MLFHKLNFRAVSSIIISVLLIAGCSQNDSVLGPSDSMRPEDVTELQIVMADSSDTLSWVNPVDSVYNHVEITFTPGVTVITQPLIISKGTDTKTITGLDNVAEYTFVVITVDDNGIKSLGISQSILLIPCAANIHIDEFLIDFYLTICNLKKSILTFF